MLNFNHIFKDTLKQEGSALVGYDGDLSDLDSIIDLIVNLKGKLVLMGIGKSGLIAQKISATLSSTGTPSFFLHPSEAMHGDLGALSKNDCVLAISYSGESLELVEILRHIRRLGIKIITFSKARDSKMSALGDYFIPINIAREACPINAAPMTSTTLSLALGDALAACLMRARDFSKSDFALFHPGGSLGRELFVKVGDLMQTQNLPLLNSDVSLKDAIIVMSKGMLGNAFFVDDCGRLLGVLSDGDLRRAMCSSDFSLEGRAFHYATKTPKTLESKEILAIDALNMMKDSKIQVLPILNNGILQGAIHLHTLLNAGFKM